MGLPWRFISASAGMVTFVTGMPAEAEPDPAGRLVMLIVVSSATPSTQDAARTKRVYACARSESNSVSHLERRWTGMRAEAESGPIRSCNLYNEKRENYAQVRYRKRNSWSRQANTGTTASHFANFLRCAA